MRVAIQGFGNAGYHLARLLQNAGYTIIALSDSQGGIYAKDGLDIESCYQYKQSSRKLAATYCKGSVCEQREYDTITNEASDMLAEQGIQVMPDVLTNAGGVIVSYFEWAQNTKGYFWSLEDIRARLHTMLSDAFEQVWEAHINDKVTLRSAAYSVAMRRIDNAISAHGTKAFFAEKS